MGTQQMGGLDDASELKKCVAKIAGLEGENRGLRKESGGFQVRIRELEDERGAALQAERGARVEAARLEGERDAAWKAAGQAQVAADSAKAEADRFRVALTEAQELKVKADKVAAVAVDALAKVETERATLAARLEQMAKDKSETERLLREAIAAQQAADDAAQFASNEKVAAETARIVAEHALFTAKSDAEQIESVLQRRLNAAQDEIKDLHDKLCKKLSGK